MTYSLDAFCEDCRTALKTDHGPGGREAVRQNLERLLAEPAFLDKHVLSAPPGRHTLYEDPELDFVVLAHINPKVTDRRRTITARPGRCTARQRTTPT